MYPNDANDIPLPPTDCKEVTSQLTFKGRDYTEHKQYEVGVIGGHRKVSLSQELLLSHGKSFKS